MLFICSDASWSNVFVMCTAVTQQNHSMTSLSLIVFESTAEVPPFESSKQSFPLESVRQLIHDMSWLQTLVLLCPSHERQAMCDSCHGLAGMPCFMAKHCSWSGHCGGTFDSPVECFWIVEHNSDRLPIPWWHVIHSSLSFGVNSFQTPITQWDDHVLSLSEGPDTAVC